MNVVPAKITICKGYREGIVLSVEDIKNVFPSETTHHTTTLADFILDNSPYIDDVFWGEQWESKIPTTPGIYVFSGEIHFDSEGDYQIYGSFGDAVFDMSDLNEAATLIPRK